MPKRPIVPNTNPPYTKYGPDTEQALERALLVRLNHLSFYAFEQCIQRLLVAMGYAGAHLLGRVHHKGRNKHGGPELEAFSSAGVTRLRVVVQVKQYTRRVQKRYVDELRGTMVRTGARQGLAITTSAFSAVAREAAHSGCIAPIRLIEGVELARLLIRYRIGVSEEFVPRVSLNEPFFVGLEA